MARLQDSVVAKAAPVMRAARAGVDPARYATADGLSVAVEVPRACPVNAEADQKLVDFPASRRHGYELGNLRVYAGTPARSR